MREKILKSFKRVQEKSTPFNTVLIGLLFIAFIALSIKNDSLFLKEIRLWGAIMSRLLFKIEKNRVYNKD